MIHYKNYVRAKDLEEAYGLMQKKRSALLGGMIWLNLGNASYGTVIDMCDLGLSGIKKEKDFFEIGAYTSLYELETDKDLNECFNNAFRDCLYDIEGVQLRNMATVGGTVALRAGFSDLCTLFLAMDAELNLYKAGRVSMEEYMNMSRKDKDIVISVSVPVSSENTVYFAERNSRTDLPLLNCTATEKEDCIRLCVGARPGKAVLKIIDRKEFLEKTPEGTEELAKLLSSSFNYGSNQRAGALYRKMLSETLIKRALEKLKGEDR